MYINTGHLYHVFPSLLGAGAKFEKPLDHPGGTEGRDREVGNRKKYWVPSRVRKNHRKTIKP